MEERVVGVEVFEVLASEEWKKKCQDEERTASLIRMEELLQRGEEGGQRGTHRKEKLMKPAQKEEKDVGE